MTTSALIVQFLAAVQSARTARIIRYMATTPLAVSPGATREALYRLKRAGKIEQIGRGSYGTCRGDGERPS